MADKKLSELPMTDMASPTDTIPINKGNTSKNITVQNLVETMPTASSAKNGILSSYYFNRLRMMNYSTDRAAPLAIKLCSIDRNSFSGVFRIFYTRSESTGISEFKVYVNAYETVSMTSIISVKKIDGSAGSIIYHDGSYLYVVLKDMYYKVFVNVEMIIKGNDDIATSEVDQSTLTLIPLSN